ncbi:hypothetical protein [Roseimaritima ulvae]|uniref:Uncharacterized protein n=1 Tax=Roseimaritima ulvae TaxID=980254 RepID=A0A5B9QRJ1_9BACT|nr:hypothetical protein [Roseimaritima ulvae]QEG41648.1 hypothetical protein UC8_36740 [Roseimaritima ulvae]
MSSSFNQPPTLTVYDGPLDVIRNRAGFAAPLVFVLAGATCWTYNAATIHCSPPFA